MALEGLQLGQYRILHLLGSGGMGEVYLAEDARIGQQVAIKVNRSEVSYYGKSDIAKDAVRLFQREARAIAKLDHPLILPLFNYGEEQVDGTTLIYIVMPFRPEGSFANWLHQHNNDNLLSAQDVAYFISQAADALQYAHNNRIVHQDVKPSNFLIRTNNRNPNRPNLLLSDFGIARLNSATAGMSHSIRGTPAYMAPEVWSGEPAPASDQYALAVMTYELFTGHPPFTGRQEQVMYQHFNVSPQPLGTFNPALSTDIDAVLHKALEKKAADRFPSIAAFANALEQATQSNDASTVINNPHTPKSWASNPHLHTEIVPPSRGDRGSHEVSAPKTLVSVPPVPQQRSGRSRISRGKAITLIVLSLLVVSASIGIFSFYGINRTTNSDAVATVHAIDATSFAATATMQSNIAHANATTTPITATATSQTNNTNPTPTVLNTNTFPPSGATLVLNDPLSNNNIGYNWETTPDADGVCQFIGGAYQVSERAYDTREYCPAYNTNFGSNFAYQVQMTIVQGDLAGLIFQDAAHQESYYWRFRQDGSYDLVLYQTATSPTLATGTDLSFNTGYNQSNRLQVIVTNNSILLFVNDQFVKRVDISNYGQGYIGVFVKDRGNPTEAVFSNAKVWKF